MCVRTCVYNHVSHGPAQVLCKGHVPLLSHAFLWSLSISLAKILSLQACRFSCCTASWVTRCTTRLLQQDVLQAVVQAALGVPYAASCAECPVCCLPCRALCCKLRCVLLLLQAMLQHALCWSTGSIACCRKLAFLCAWEALEL